RSITEIWQQHQKPIKELILSIDYEISLEKLLKNLNLCDVHKQKLIYTILGSRKGFTI
uniref:Uncharacterized protein n=1 Tax=Trichobilharzia regenti TaxID=157069 RepID=A0AA85IXT1_TRIRE